MQKRVGATRWAAWLLVVAGLTACGGGGSDTAQPARMQASPMLQSEARVQLSGVHASVGVKSRALAPATLPLLARVQLGELILAKGAPLREDGVRLVGVSRSLAETAAPDDLAARWHWKTTPAGTKVAALSVLASGAHGLRLALRVEALPADALLRVYSQARPETVYELAGKQVLETIERNLAAGETGDAAQTWWTPELGADEQTLEIELPPDTDPQALRVSVPQVSHIFEDLSVPPEGTLVSKINESDTCNLDASCYDEGAAQRNAVARMVFTKDGSTYACTGTLLNDLASSGTPYFLSANHCISTQAAASSLQTDWFYRSPTCNSRTLSSASVRRFGGATLLYASSASDISFMRLNEVPPIGAMFAAWDATPQASGAAVYGLHHPRTDLLKISLGSVVGELSCTNLSGTQFTCNGTSGNFYQVQWTKGTTESGSSGSALFRGGYVVGTLFGGAATCTPSGGFDVYGRLEVAFKDGISQWLGGGSGAVPRNAFAELVDRLLTVDPTIPISPSKKLIRRE